ncbi:hypothetical protein [Yunchengibacter salinarum]|uniref:hypothetical protein n=1 Tax=Yunchengibacter salinarum TaxID=3133399 RepID=UPI0035B5BE7C
MMDALRLIVLSRPRRCAASGAAKALRALMLGAGLAGGVLMGQSVTAPAAHAQAADSGAVLQVVDRINGELKLMYRASLRDIPDKGRENMRTRQPRHVYQKLRSTYMQLQLFRWLSGEPRKTPEPLPLRQITPGEVLELTETFLSDLRDVKPAYFLAKTVAEPEKRSNVTPTDVFEALTYSEQLLLGMDMPATVPNDVYQLALMLLEDARSLHRAIKGGDAGVDLALTTTGKVPADAYDASMTVLDTLSALTDSGKLSIPAGVVRPARPGTITPNSVMRLMGDILADLNAAKISAGVSEQTEMPPSQSGKTPSNVVDVLITTNRILSAI